MKNILYLLFIFSLNLYGQPGDKFGVLRMGEFIELSDSIAKYPDNYELKWVRTEMMFSPYFDMYTQPILFSKNDSIADLFQNLEVLSYKEINIELELNKIIEKNIELEIDAIDYPYYTCPDGNKITKAHLLYKRGQYYYLNNKTDRALEDFLMALNLNPPKHLKERICISIAAYYYTFDKVPKRVNLEKSLKYIDMVTPTKYEVDPRVINKTGDHNYDLFENEKISLLISTNQQERLFNYLLNLSKSWLSFHWLQINSPANSEYSSYSKSSSKENGLNYMTRLIDYSKRFENPEKYMQKLCKLINDL